MKILSKNCLFILDGSTKPQPPLPNRCFQVIYSFLYTFVSLKLPRTLGIKSIYYLNYKYSILITTLNDFSYLSKQTEKQIHKNNLLFKNIIPIKPNLL